MRYSKTISNIITTERINSIIRFFRKLPIIKKYVSDKYDFSNLSKIITFFAPISSLFNAVLLNAFKMIIVVVYLSSYTKKIGYDFDSTKGLYAIALISLFTFGTMFSEYHYDESRLFTRVFKMDPKDYILTKTATYRFYDLIAKVIILLIFYRVYGLFYIFTLAFFNQAFILLFSIYNAYQSTKLTEIEKKKSTATIILISLLKLAILLGITAGLVFYVGERAIGVLDNPIALVASVLLLGYSIYLCVNFKHFSKLVYVSIQNENDIEKVKSEAKTSNLKLKGEESESKEIYESEIKGSDALYLNRLLFKRLRKNITKSVIYFYIIALLAILALIGADIFVDNTIISSIFTLPFVWICFACVLNRTTSMVNVFYYNCDMPLLRYSFYRTKSFILRSFLIRLLFTSVIALAPQVLFIVLLGGFGLYRGISPYTILLVAVFDFSLSIFITVLNLALYYIIQPFGSDATIKSPLYTLSTFVSFLPLYIGVFINKLAPVLTTTITLATLLVTVLLDLALIFLVLKRAPKSFKNRVG